MANTVRGILGILHILCLDLAGAIKNEDILAHISTTITPSALPALVSHSLAILGCRFEQQISTGLNSRSVIWMFDLDLLQHFDLLQWYPPLA